MKSAKAPFCCGDSEVVVTSPNGSPNHPMRILSNAVHGLAALKGRHAGGVGAIVGTGTSLEGFDFGQLERLDATIGVNEATKLCVPDYLVLCDRRAVPKAAPFLVPERTTVVMACRTMNGVARGGDEREQGPLSKVRELYYAEFTQHTVTPEDSKKLFYNRGILTAGLSLAVWLGLKRCFLFGFDFFRREEKLYAYDISPARPEQTRTTGMPNRLTTPAFDSMKLGVETNLGQWKSCEFVNMSRHSLLTCFPIDEENSLPKP